MQTETIKRQFPTATGYAISISSYMEGKSGGMIETGFYKKNQKSPYLVKRTVINVNNYSLTNAH